MARGDRVIIGDGYNWTDADKHKTMAYLPRIHENDRKFLETPDGGVIIEAVGGVMCGSRGVINGDIIKVHRSYLHDKKTGASFNSTDFVELVPVFLEKYQRVGYFPVDHVRIYGTAL